MVGRLRSAHRQVGCMMVIWNFQASLSVYVSLLFNGELESEFSVLSCQLINRRGSSEEVYFYRQSLPIIFPPYIHIGILVEI